jgi:hypothetical protein
MYDSKDPGVVARFREAAASIGSQSKAAKAACVSIGSMKLYLAGKVPPSVMALGNIAAASGFSLDWILTGKGERMRSLDNPRQLDAALLGSKKSSDLLRKLRAIADAYHAEAVELARDNEDDLIGAAFDIVDAAPEAIDVNWLVKIIVSVHQSVAHVMSVRRKAVKAVQEVDQQNASGRLSKRTPA